VIRTRSSGSVSWLTTSAVMIFARLAIGRTFSGRRRNSTSPLSTSNTSAARGAFLKRDA
jgi:hypothetical protein